MKCDICTNEAFVNIKWLGSRGLCIANLCREDAKHFSDRAKNTNVGQTATYKPIEELCEYKPDTVKT